MPFNAALAERFWRNVNKTPACWLWTAGQDGRGYGSLRVNGVMVKTHRLSWVIHNGDIPPSMNVLHRCDTPRCVRPDHLFLGTQSDNNADRQAKGRSRGGKNGGTAKGSRVGGARLTEADVPFIRRLHYYGLADSEIARAYGVARATINSVVRRRSWGHVPC